MPPLASNTRSQGVTPKDGNGDTDPSTNDPFLQNVRPSDGPVQEIQYNLPSATYNAKQIYSIIYSASRPTILIPQNKDSQQTPNPFLALPLIFSFRTEADYNTTADLAQDQLLESLSSRTFAEMQKSMRMQLENILEGKRTKRYEHRQRVKRVNVNSLESTAQGKDVEHVHNMLAISAVGCAWTLLGTLGPEIIFELFKHNYVLDSGLNRYIYAHT